VVEYTPEEWAALGADPNAVHDPTKTAPLWPAAVNDPSAQALLSGMGTHWGMGAGPEGSQFTGLDFNQVMHDSRGIEMQGPSSNSGFSPQSDPNRWSRMWGNFQQPQGSGSTQGSAAPSFSFAGNQQQTADYLSSIPQFGQIVAGIPEAQRQKAAGYFEPSQITQMATAGGFDPTPYLPATPAPTPAPAPGPAMGDPERWDTLKNLPEYQTLDPAVQSVLKSVLGL
jgi:hypothetical protein